MNEAGTCPPWCAGDHDEEDVIHRTQRTEIAVRGHSGHLSVTGGTFGGVTEIAVHSSWYGVGAVTTRGDVYVPAREAGQLAALLEVLAHATPAQHRELAAAIRAAAAQITEAGNG